MSTGKPKTNATLTCRSPRLHVDSSPPSALSPQVPRRQAGHRSRLGGVTRGWFSLCRLHIGCYTRPSGKFPKTDQKAGGGTVPETQQTAKQQTVFSPFVGPNENRPEFTIRAVLLGAVFGIIFGGVTVYVGLEPVSLWPPPFRSRSSPSACCATRASRRCLKPSLCRPAAMPASRLLPASSSRCPRSSSWASISSTFASSCWR